MRGRGLCKLSKQNVAGLTVAELAPRTSAAVTGSQINPAPLPLVSQGYHLILSCHAFWMTYIYLGGCLWRFRVNLGLLPLQIVTLFFSLSALGPSP